MPCFDRLCFSWGASAAAYSVRRASPGDDPLHLTLSAGADGPRSGYRELIQGHSSYRLRDN
jgi:hypothetical protein